MHRSKESAQTIFTLEQLGGSWKYVCETRSSMVEKEKSAPKQCFKLGSMLFKKTAMPAEEPRGAETITITQYVRSSRSSSRERMSSRSTGCASPLLS